MRWIVYGRDVTPTKVGRWTAATGPYSFLDALRFAIECDQNDGWWGETLIWPDDGTRPEGHRSNWRDRRPEVPV